MEIPAGSFLNVARSLSASSFDMEWTKITPDLTSSSDDGSAEAGPAEATTAAPGTGTGSLADPNGDFSDGFEAVTTRKLKQSAVEHWDSRAVVHLANTSVSDTSEGSDGGDVVYDDDFENDDDDDNNDIGDLVDLVSLSSGGTSEVGSGSDDLSALPTWRATLTERGGAEKSIQAKVIFLPQCAVIRTDSYSSTQLRVDMLPPPQWNLPQKAWQCGSGFQMCEGFLDTLALAAHEAEKAGNGAAVAAILQVTEYIERVRRAEPLRTPPATPASAPVPAPVPATTPPVGTRGATFDAAAFLALALGVVARWLDTVAACIEAAAVVTGATLVPWLRRGGEALGHVGRGAGALLNAAERACLQPRPAEAPAEMSAGRRSVIRRGCAAAVVVATALVLAAAWTAPRRTPPRGRRRAARARCSLPRARA